MLRRAPVLFAVMAFALAAGPAITAAQAACATPQAVCDCCPAGTNTDECGMCATQPEGRTEATVQPGASSVPVMPAEPLVLIARSTDFQVVSLVSSRVSTPKRYLTACSLRL